MSAIARTIPAGGAGAVAVGLAVGVAMGEADPGGGALGAEGDAIDEGLVDGMAGGEAVVPQALTMKTRRTRMTAKRPRP